MNEASNRSEEKEAGGKAQGKFCAYHKNWFVNLNINCLRPVSCSEAIEEHSRWITRY